MAVAAQASLLQSFPFRVAVFALFVLMLPLVPSPQVPAGLAGRGEAFLAKAWELLHLLFVGIAVSYGLFGRRNDAGRRADDEKDVAAAAAAAAAAKPDAGYVSQMLHDSLVFDDGGGDEVLDSPGAKVRSWSALHHPDEPVVMVATGGGGRSHAADAQQAPMSLPVRTLKPQQVDSNAGYSHGEPRARPRRNSQDTAGAHETVLPSPIPWRSRSGRFDASPSPSPSPKTLSPASSLSKEALAKASEDYANRRRSPYKSSPPAPPPPPPPFLVHGYHPAAERRTAAKSFKEELQDLSMRGRVDHYPQSSHSFSSSAYSSNSSPANPRSSIDGSSSSYYSVGRSVRTTRAREVVQSQSQELPGVAGDAPDLRGTDDPYGGYSAYQSIPRFQYERESDPILGKVTISSETESSDDDDDGDGEFSTGANSPRESTPEVDENEVDKKAEEFIARFREQIRLQRIASIKKSAGPRGVKHGK
ncbi:hypothetical protein GUJ93_ZPchr0012g18975 [Zizania palustris]|uniref:Uncharacterized protein n=1 Tax=Zizania palustris TaxID=103762 RepID=A0A8J5WPW8_ZIZPA|nr:hypothetical protein GUJ93_ZPchr0012g18975 [Zizania palustris]